MKTLKGAPEEVGGNFECYGCKSLTSLKGGPKKVGGHFRCTSCDSLTSLEGAPEKVSGDFDCRGCKGQFTEKDVTDVCDVKGKISI